MGIAHFTVQYSFGFYYVSLLNLWLLFLCSVLQIEDPRFIRCKTSIEIKIKTKRKRGGSPPVIMVEAEEKP